MSSLWRILGGVLGSMAYVLSLALAAGADLRLLVQALLLVVAIQGAALMPLWLPGVVRWLRSRRTQPEPVVVRDPEAEVLLARERAARRERRFWDSDRWGDTS